MKIKKLKMNNFANFSQFECEFDGQLTRLVGITGSGKTTVGLTAIWACLKGIAENNRNGSLIGERFRFIGNGKASADIELTLYDEKAGKSVIIKNHITKASNDIKFEPESGYSVSNDWLENLLSVVFLSAKNFTQLSSKEQALALGIDTSKFDSKIQELKSEFTGINRELKSFGTLVEPEKVEQVDVSKLMDKKDSLDTFNNRQTEKQSDIENAQSKIDSLTEQKNTKLQEIEKLQQELNELETRIDKGNQYILNLPQPEPQKDTTTISQQIRDAGKINDKAADYKRYIQDKKQYDKIKDELTDNKAKQETETQKRLDYIKSFKFGFDNLTVNDEGELLLQNRPIRDPYFSKGQLEIIVAKLYASLNPDLKTRFIDDFDLLDDTNQEKLVKDLIEQGFQIITAEVHGKTEGDNVLVLRDCKIFDDKQETLL